MAHLYYDETLTPETLKPGAELTITGEEARHAVSVARLRTGEQVLIGNGGGEIAVTRVSDVVKGSAPAFTAVVSELQTPAPSGLKTVLVQALAQGDRDTRAVEQTTEFGVNAIIPWAASRSVSLWQNQTKQQKGQQKWQRIAREAAKQSLRAVIPEVMQIHTTAELARLCGEAGTLALVLDPRAPKRLSEVLGQLPAATDTLLLIVGPEGGITETETTSLTATGAVGVRLGDTVLRTSSAGAAALAVANTVQEHW